MFGIVPRGSFAGESNRTREEDSTQFEDSKMLHDAQITDAFGTLT